MHCYKLKGTRFSVSQVRLPLGRERGQSVGNNRGTGREEDFRDPWSLFQSYQCLHAISYHSLTFREGEEGKKHKPQSNQSQERNKWIQVEQRSSGFSKAPCLGWAGNIFEELCVEERQHRNISSNSSLVRKTFHAGFSSRTLLFLKNYVSYLGELFIIPRTAC